MKCPCDSGLDYAVCCQAFHEGAASVPTAESLMRSRYSAYVLGKIQYLVASTHPRALRPDLEDGYRSTCKSIQWIGLEVLKTHQGGESDKTGKVEFKASYIQGGHRTTHHEKSRFKRHAGKWHYLDGVIEESADS